LTSLELALVGAAYLGAAATAVRAVVAVLEYRRRGILRSGGRPVRKEDA
jgi:hypothetical protein